MELNQGDTDCAFTLTVFYFICFLFDSKYFYYLNVKKRNLFIKISFVYAEVSSVEQFS